MPSPELIAAALANKNNRCPCCEQRFAADLRRLYAEPVVFLVKLVRVYLDRLRAGDTDVWIASRDLIKAKAKSSSDGAYLVHWGLVEKAGKGFYRPTEAGIRFVRGEERQPCGLWVVGGQVVDQDTRQVLISDVLPERLRVDELMNMPLLDLLRVDARHYRL